MNRGKRKAKQQVVRDLAEKLTPQQREQLEKLYRRMQQLRRCHLHEAGSHRKKLTAFEKAELDAVLLTPPDAIEKTVFQSILQDSRKRWYLAFRSPVWKMLNDCIGAERLLYALFGDKRLDPN